MANAVLRFHKIKWFAVIINTNFRSGSQQKKLFSVT